VPEALLSEVPRLPGIDNRTMHTSYGNTILLMDTPEETRAKVMAMYTDPARVHASDPGKVDGNPVFVYHDLFNPDQAMVSDLKARYRKGQVGDVEVKQLLADALNDYLAPLRARREALAQDPGGVINRLHAGTEKARPFVQNTLREVQAKMGLMPADQFNGPVSDTRYLQKLKNKPLSFV